MKGSQHLAIGVTVGVGTGLLLGNDFKNVLLFGVVGAIGGLLPDIDVAGLLTNKITLSKKIIQIPTLIIGFLLILYSFIEGIANIDYLQLLLGVGIIVIGRSIKQKRMLTLSGIIMGMIGVALTINWLILLSIFVVIASFSAHRGVTHSLIGVGFVSFIAFKIEQQYQISGIQLVIVVSYIMHLICDMKFIPFNKKGIKLFAPFLQTEI